ncbi:MAG: hypothetical protein RKE49_05500 [Oceanicaulis sp.]
MTRLLRLLAAALLAWQALAAGAMAGSGHGAAQPGGATLMCGDQIPDAQGRALLAELAALTGLDGGSHDRAHQDCPVCALVHAAALPGVSDALTPAVFAAFAQQAGRAERAAPRLARGPPVGLRAPPALV